MNGEPGGGPRDGAPAIRLRGVRRRFKGGAVAVDGVDLEVPAGELVAIVGPSGCGKSTLLRLVAGLDRPQAGEVLVGDRGGSAAAPSRLAFVFQDAHLLPWRTVLANVELPLELAGAARPARRAAALSALAQVGLADAARLYPAQLSGGMRMRASLARALVTEPATLLLDEPFAAVDEITRQRLDEQLHALWAARRMTVVFVTHSLAEAAFLAQRVVVLSRRPARVVADVAGLADQERTVLLRTEPSFNELVRRLHAALAEGEG